MPSVAPGAQLGSRVAINWKILLFEIWSRQRKMNQATTTSTQREKKILERVTNEREREKKKKEIVLYSYIFKCV